MFFSYFLNLSLIWSEFDIRLMTKDLENIYISQALMDQIIRSIDFENFYWPDGKLIRSNQITLSRKSHNF